LLDPLWLDQARGPESRRSLSKRLVPGPPPLQCYSCPGLVDPAISAMTALMGNAVEKPAKARELRSQTRTSLALCPVDRSGAARRELRKAAGGGGTWRLFVATIFQPAGGHCSRSGLSLNYPPTHARPPAGVERLIFGGLGAPAARASLIQWKTSLMSGFNSLIWPN
jgi:hypothetical protein